MRRIVLLAMFGVALAPLFVPAAEVPPPRIALSGKPAPLASAPVCGFSVIATGDGPQMALMPSAGRAVVALFQGESVEIDFTVGGLRKRFAVSVDARLLGGSDAIATLAAGGRQAERRLSSKEVTRLELRDVAARAERHLVLRLKAESGEAAVRVESLSCVVGDRQILLPLTAASIDENALPAPALPPLRLAIEEALVAWDWRMQDGIGTQRDAYTYAEALERVFLGGDLLIEHLRGLGASLNHGPELWLELKRELRCLKSSGGDEAQWEALWLATHRVRRAIAMANPRLPEGAILFAKQVPGSFSHQLTQYYGRYARPGGGLFVLQEPGRSMRCQRLAEDALPVGSFQHPEVSYDGRRVLFSYCHAETPPDDGIRGHRGRYYHVYEIGTDGTGLRQLTDGPFDDFSPKYLPDGRIVFISTRRGGWHRCGTPGCENYTLAVMEADGSGPRPISFHETQEWDPAVLHDGRIIYTRWDYVDRHAVYYEQLWTTRPDGSLPSALYGNNTFNPVGVWEARPVPESTKVMATAAPHHGMTAGSIVLVDASRGNEGPGPLERLTPEVPFPESEAVLLPRWRATAGIAKEGDRLRLCKPPSGPLRGKRCQSLERWPGQCFRSPWPLSEDVFLAAYSFDPLIGEPEANRPSMFGIYLVDRWGNKELLYRDLNIASLWPVPLQARKRPPAIPAPPREPQGDEAVVFVQNVYAADPPLPAGEVRRLRIVQVLPKSTPGINNPPVGLPNASPGKQVLGTVPVESDGSVLFLAPAGVPLSFQALDAQGQAVQVMRSLTYLRPGERMSCVGCHEHRMTSPRRVGSSLALAGPPSAIEPGPEGSKPLSYPLLVQPVLDRKCVKCHRPDRPEGKVILTGQPQGHYTLSYNALAPRVSYSAWGKPGDFRRANSEPVAQPSFFGARASPLMKLLAAGHEGVELTPEERERLVTWMDANALFYGTFDREDQARQRRGERIAGPALE